MIGVGQSARRFGVCGRSSSWRSRDPLSTSGSFAGAGSCQPYCIVCSICDSRSPSRPRSRSGCAGFRLKGHIKADLRLGRDRLRPHNGVGGERERDGVFRSPLGLGSWVWRSTASRPDEASACSGDRLAVVTYRCGAELTTCSTAATGRSAGRVRNVPWVGKRWPRPHGHPDAPDEPIKSARPSFAIKGRP